MKKILLVVLALGLNVSAVWAGMEEGFVSLFDGKTMAGWKTSEENAGTWKIEDGALVTRGPRAHLFYMGELAPFKNFELRVEVKTERNSNGGIYFHTAYQKEGWPVAGFECQVNVSHKDWKKTGSVYDVASLGLTPVVDGEWWTQTILVEGNKVTVKLNGVTVVQYTEPPGAQAGEKFGRKLGQGTFALQAHDPESVVYYRNIRVKKLP